MAISTIDVIKIYQQKTALVIDDFPDMRSSIRRMLEHFGVQRVDTSANGEDAISRCEQTDYDIILADYNLGDAKNGQQILEELRYKKRLKNTAIYMMITAETTKQMVFGALENQPDDYLTKPFTQGVLEKRLSRLVIEKQALHEINVARDRHDYARAAVLCQQYLEREDNYRHRCLRIMAQCLCHIGQYPQAQKIYQSILEQRELEWATIGLGKTMLALNELANAETLFNQLLSNGCQCMEVYDALAEIKLQQREPEAAQQILETAISISPNALPRQENLAAICEDNQNWPQARQAHHAVIRLSKNSVYETPEHYFRLARCIADEMQHRRTDTTAESQAEATEVLKAARRHFKEQPVIALQADIIEANLLASIGEDNDPEATLLALQERIKSASDVPPQLLLDMAQTCKATGHHDKAQALLQKLMDTYHHDEHLSAAIDRLADDPLSEAGKQKVLELNQQGKTLFANKEYPEAIQLFSQALLHHPNNVGLNLNLMLALISEMSHAGTTEAQLDHCVRIKNTLAHLTTSNPLHERYQALCGHLDKLAREPTPP